MNMLNAVRLVGLIAIIVTWHLILNYQLILSKFKQRYIMIYNLKNVCLPPSNNNITEKNDVRGEFRRYGKMKHYKEIEKHLKYLKLKNGGEWKPKGCESRYKIAIIVPYRNRTRNLKFFLNYMHRFLANQNVHYKIYLVEPLQKLTFNRGLLMNAGFLEAIKESNDKWNCFIFHDVDMLPENSSNLYKCDSEMPLHLAVAVSQFNYKIDGYFVKFFGGVNAFTKHQFLNVSGFSNLYFGWGKEDDDLYHRSLLKFTTIRKLDPKEGRYYSLKHNKESMNPKGVKILAKAKVNLKRNGITEGLNTIVYSLKKTQKRRLYTHFFVNYDEKLILKIGFNNSKFKLGKL